MLMIVRSALTIDGSDDNKGATWPLIHSCHLSLENLFQNKLVSVERPFSAQIGLYHRQKVRGGDLSLPSKGRSAIY